MSPILSGAIITAFSELLRLSPQLVADVKKIFEKNEPTEADWVELKAKASRDYFSYVPASDLPRPSDATKPDV